MRLTIGVMLVFSIQVLSSFSIANAENRFEPEVPQNKNNACTGIAAAIECLSRAAKMPGCSEDVNSIVKILLDSKIDCSRISICEYVSFESQRNVKTDSKEAIQEISKLYCNLYTASNNALIEYWGGAQGENILVFRAKMCEMDKAFRCKDPFDIKKGDCQAVAAMGETTWEDGEKSPTNHAFNICRRVTSNNGTEYYVVDPSCKPSIIDIKNKADTVTYTCNYHGSNPKNVGRTGTRLYPAPGHTLACCRPKIEAIIKTAERLRDNASLVP